MGLANANKLTKTHHEPRKITHDEFAQKCALDLMRDFTNVHVSHGATISVITFEELPDLKIVIEPRQKPK